MTSGRTKYWDVFDQVHRNLSEYYFHWYFDRPMVVTSKRDRELHRICTILGKCLHFYAEHYKEYLHLIPYEPRVLSILEKCKFTPYNIGTSRIDYIISEDNRILVCEITARFFGNGYFLSFFADKKGRELAAAAGVKVKDSRMEDMLAYLAKIPRYYDKICVLKSADRSDSIKLYVPFYSALGKEVEILEFDDTSEKEMLKKTEGAFILSALNQKDVLSLSDRMIFRMIRQGYYNDFRSVFLAHDKRVFSLFFEDDFTGRVLNDEETAFLRSHVIPTTVWGMYPDRWEMARKNKNDYIVKHYCLGKSEKVYAGQMTDEETWSSLWEDHSVEHMVLQPFIRQKSFPNHWDGNDYIEYISGTILMLDDRYFGTGLFRSSSLPVLNKGDDRKVGIVLSDKIKKFKGKCLIL